MDYKEKLEEAKKLYAYANAAQKYVLESLFPELAGSEDEKIRKALVEMVHDTTGDELWVDYNIHKEEALAWLKKQGEQKPFDYENANIQQKDWAEIPFGTKDSELQEATYIIPEGFHAEIKGNEVFIKKGVQKPAWSEEDEDAIGMAIIALGDMYDPDEPNNTYAGYSIPFNKAVERLKLLRPQKQWKPSEEQMKLLKELVEDNSQRYFYTILKSLYEQLKKLREE